MFVLDFMCISSISVKKFLGRMYLSYHPYGTYFLHVSDGIQKPSAARKIVDIFSVLRSKYHVGPVKELADFFCCTEEHARRVCIRLKRQGQVERVKHSIKLGRPIYVYTAKTFPTSGI